MPNRDYRLSRRAVFGILASTGVASAQGTDAWPSRSIRLVVPFGPGGPTDVMARVIAPGLSAALGRPVVVENRPGASGNVGIAHAARSAADGYTLLVTSTGFVVNPTLFRNPGYDIFKDFIPITELGASPNTILTRPDTGIMTLADLIARAKATPGGLNIANPGLGSTPHLTAELLRLRAGIEFVQITHQSAAQAVQAVLSGTTPIGVAALPPAHPQIKSGTLRALALTGEKRWHDLPDVPTMLELGYEGFVSETFQGLLAPTGTPQAILDRLAEVTITLLNEAETKNRLLNAGFTLNPRGPQGLAERIAREVPLWRDVIEKAGIPRE
jgi:tripartite-type tricarboxylate transporter receptor subunit TctC